MQVCNSLQTDNHANTPSLGALQAQTKNNGKYSCGNQPRSSTTALNPRRKVLYSSFILLMMLLSNSWWCLAIKSQLENVSGWAWCMHLCTDGWTGQKHNVSNGRGMTTLIQYTIDKKYETFTPITFLAPAFAANMHRIPVPQPTSSTTLFLNKCLLWIMESRYVNVRTSSFSISYISISMQCNYSTFVGFIHSPVQWCYIGAELFKVFITAGKNNQALWDVEYPDFSISSQQPASI